MDMGDIYKEYSEATRGLESQARRERERIAREVTTQRGKIEGQRATLTSQLNTILGNLEASRKMEMRKRDLPITKPSRALLASIAGSSADVKRQAAKHYAELDKLLAELETAEGEAITDIARQVSEKQAEINKWRSESEASYKEYQQAVARAETERRKYEAGVVVVGAERHKLDTGEWVDKSYWDSLRQQDKDYLNKYGIERFNKYYIPAQTWLTGATEKKLEPYKVEGGYDLVAIRKAGINIPLLLSAGFSQTDIKAADKFIADQKAITTTLVPFMTTYKTAQEAYNAGVITMKEFMAWKNIELYPKGRKGYTPVSTYDLAKARNAGVSENFLVDAGFDRADIKEMVAYDKVLTDLKQYTDKEGKIDIIGALKNKAVTTADLKLIGIDDKAIRQGEHYAGIGKVRTFWEGITPWEEWKGEKASAKGVGEMAAVMLIPGVWAKDWNEMDNKWRAINIAIDIAYILPFVGWIARGAKIGAIGLRALRISSKAIRATSRTAKVAGKAQLALAEATKALHRLPMGARGYPKLASRVQHLAQASMKADKAFANSIMKLTKVTPRELAKFEKLSKMPGIKQSVIDVGKSQTELSKAWDILGKYKVGSKEYIQQLTKVQAAQARLGTTLGKFDKAMRPRQKVGVSTGWDRIISGTEKELQRAESELERLLAKQKKGLPIDLDYLKELKATIKSLKAELHNFKASKAAGESPPLPEGYKAQWTEIPKAEPEKLMSDIEGFLKQRKGISEPGIQQPLPFKGGGVASPTRVAVKVAPKVKPAIKPMPGVSKLKLKPIYKPTAKIPVAKPTAPKVKPKVDAKPTPTEIAGITAAEWARMPVAAREKALREIEATAYEAVIAPATRGLTKASEIAVVQAATRAAIRNATRAITRGATQAELATQLEAVLKPLTKIVPKTRIKAIVKAITKITTKLTPKIRPKPKLKPRLRIRIPLPDGTTRLLTKREAEGIIAWKQGIMYKLLYPPFGQKQIVNSRKPLAGVKYYSGAGSAAKSIIAKHGIIPAEVTRDMGIMDITIRTPPQKRSKPRIHFRRDIKQRTRTTPRPSIGTMR